MSRPRVLLWLAVGALEGRRARRAIFSHHLALAKWPRGGSVRGPCPPVGATLTEGERYGQESRTRAAHASH